MSDAKKLWSYQTNVIPFDLAIKCMEQLSAFVTDNHEPERKSRPNQPLFHFFSEPPGQPYRYFTSDVKGTKFLESLTALNEIAKTLCPNVPFDAAFVNLYRSGVDHVPAHQDTTHGEEYPIVSFSLYPEKHTPRVLEILTNQGKLVEKFSMEQGSAVIMHKGMQKDNLHLVLTDDSKTQRINVTLRVHGTLAQK